MKRQTVETLNADRPRFWTPDPVLLTRALGMAHGLVVDLGPGQFPLPWAGAKRIGWGWDNTDITTDRLPFNDNEVDFLYCRHTLEDLLDPCHTLREIARVAKSGWIEVPSIVSELAFGVDAVSQEWRGYCHHRSLFWRSGDTLITTPKYALLEYQHFPDLPLADALRKQSAWNFVFTFDGPLKWRQLRHEVDYHLARGDYAPLVATAAADFINEKASQDPPTAEA